MSNLPIEQQYEKWMRFENFLKFAEKKEVRDRLKEFDPPPVSNYIDATTVDNIVNKRRKTQRPITGKKANKANAGGDGTEH